MEQDGFCLSLLEKSKTAYLAMGLFKGVIPVLGGNGRYLLVSSRDLWGSGGRRTPVHPL